MSAKPRPPVIPNVGDCPEWLQRIAVHEAGHVVIARVLGVRFNYVTIGAAAGMRRRRSKATTLRLDLDGGWCPELAFRCAQVSLAGARAELYFFRVGPYGDRTDRRNAFTYAIQHIRRGAFQNGRLNYSEFDAARASRLLRVLRDEVDALLGNVFLEGAVVDLARALIAKQRLSHADVIAVLKESNRRICEEWEWGTYDNAAPPRLRMTSLYPPFRKPQGESKAS
jgi:hypothetical protein